MPSLNHLSTEYLQRQRERVLISLDQIVNDRESKTGRSIPSENSLRLNDGRRVAATVLFLDICGFSDRYQCTETEQDRELKALAVFFSEMVRVINDYGGVVEKNTGDGLMAYFEGVRSGENGSPHKAVACALTIFYTAAQIVNPVIAKAGLIPFEFRMCADFGDVTIARLGSSRLFNGIVAIGSHVNSPAKMLSKAKGNQFLIGNDLAISLPRDWQNKFVNWLSPVNSTYNYRENGKPYPFYFYNGRWES
ncbi:adenylate/guanylate cyclase domain-containing protein [Erythrobacter sp.]|nr:adenylate/guanylate cyclase domain-containing protein [Erythrobacter sp.]